MMKGIYLVAILCVATLSVAQNVSPVTDFPTECPTNIKPRNKTIYLPHENDCTKFYSCHMGKKGKPLDCPFMDDNGNRLHFNPVLQVCDWPWSAGCQLSSIRPTSIPTRSTSSLTLPTSSLSPSTTTILPSSSLTPSTSPSSPLPPTISSSSSPTPPASSSNPPTTATSSSSSSTPPTSSSSSPTTLPPSSSIPPTSPSSTPTTTISSSNSPTPPTSSSNPPTTATSSSNSSTPLTSPSSSPTTLPPSSSTPPTSPSSPPTTPTSSSSSSTPSTSPSSSSTTLPPSSSTPPTSPSSPSTTTISSSSSPTSSTSSSNPPPTTATSSSFPTSPTSSSSSLTTTTSSSNPPPTTTLPSSSSTPPTSPSSDPPTTISSSISPTSPISSSSPPPPPTSSTSSSTPSIPASSPTSSNTTKNTPVTSPSWTCEFDDRTHMIPHKTMCDHYYTCINGKVSPEPKKCDRNLLFNPILRVCDYPENVNCNYTPSNIVRSTTTTVSPAISSPTAIITTSSTSSSPTQTSPLPSPSPTTTTTAVPATTTEASEKPRKECPPKGSSEVARIAHDCLCNVYYECVNGYKMHQTCPTGMHFDYVREICDWPETVNCVRPISILNILIGSCQSKCYPEGRAFQHEINCSSYYLCSEGKKILKHCTAGLHFNVTLQICDYPAKPGCDLTAKFLPTTTLATCPPSGSAEKVLLPHECACELYYECVDGNQVQRKCPNGLHFDRIGKGCKKPDEANCPYVCPCPSSSEKVLLPHECKCEHYYECVKGKRALRTCPNGQHFDSIQKICMHPDEANCATDTPEPTTTTTDTTITTTTEAPDKPRKKCPPKGSTEIARIAHPFVCNMYYLCVNGIKILLMCPIGMHFDYVREVCDWAFIVKCIRPIPTNDILIDNDLDPSTCIGTCPEEDPEYAVLLPNEDCKKFCLCSNGFAWVQPCPEPLYFDSIDKVCKNKRDAVCAERLFNQDRASMLHRMVDDENSVQPLNEENNDEQEIRDNSWSKVRIYNLDPSTCIGTCPEEDPEYAVLLPNEDCKKFCMCSNSFAWVQPCPVPLYFDSIDKVCKNKRDAVCAERSFNQDRASMLYRMVDDENSVQPLNEENNDEQEIRDNSWSKVRIYNLDPSTCIGTCPEEDPEYAVLLPNEDCKKFCMCSNSFAWVQPCPVPLYFDSIDKVCKNKRDAVCAVRSFN